MEIAPKNLVFKNSKNNLSTMISDSLELISSLMSNGEISRAKTQLLSLLKFCEKYGRLPQLFIQWKKYKELDGLELNTDLFLAQGKLSQSSSINKVLKLLSKEEIFYLIETDTISWRHIRELLTTLTGRYHDVRSLKLFLVSCILKKENTIDSVRIFLKRYPSISRLCFNLLSEKDKTYFNSKETKDIEQVKIIKRRFDFNFDTNDSTEKNRPKKSALTKTTNNIDEIYYLDQFIQMSKSYTECLDSLLLNRLYVAADFYYELVKEKISLELKDLYFVEIRRGLERRLEVVGFIKKNKLFNQENPSLGRHYYEILKAMHEDK